MKIKRLVLATLGSIVLVASTFVPTTQAQNQPPDDNQNGTPTAWWIYSGQTPADISNTTSAENARPVDISVDAFSPNYSLTVTYVKNTGAYAKNYWWYVGIDGVSLNALLTINNARLEVLKAFDVGSGIIRFAAVMVSNTGGDAKEWWYYGQISASDLGNAANTNNARITSLQSYVSQGNTWYAAVMISNTGSDAASWWWYLNITGEEVTNEIAANNATILDLTPAGGGNFNVAMVSCANGCPEWWWTPGVSLDQIGPLTQQKGARVNAVGTYPGCGGTCYSLVMLNDANAITSRVRDILLANGIGGVEGLYLQQVGGPVLANLEDGVIYEPASSIKVLIHLYALTQVQKGNINLNSQVVHYINGPDSCPDPPVLSGTEPLQIALREMMWHSDNARTHELTDFFGDANLNAFAHSIGMTNTSINHIIGCGGPIPDMMTQDDAATLYQGVADGTLLDSNSMGTFYSLMAGKSEFESEGGDFTGIWSPDVATIISQEAPAGYTVAQEKAYQANMDLAYKAGGYVLCADSNCDSMVDDSSLSGWFQVPFCTTGGTSYNQYVFGIFLYDVPDSPVTGTNFNNAKAELMREQVQAGLTSCLHKSLDTMSWSPADLTFPIRTVGTTSPVKNITLVNRQKTTVTGISITVFGDFSQTNTCPASLAPGARCSISVAFTPGATGTRVGAVVVSDGGSGEPQTMELTGTGR